VVYSVWNDFDIMVVEANQKYHGNMVASLTFIISACFASFKDGYQKYYTGDQKNNAAN